MTLPACFCWTRFGTEAGQLIEQIFERKEQERIANQGLFFWGIGNALGPSITELLQHTRNPEVLFSPIKSTPRLVDSSPTTVVAWNSAETIAGEPFELPRSSLVTSRFGTKSGREARYALVCFSARSLHSQRCDEKIAPEDLRNLITGRPIGASQVTAVVQKTNVMTSRVPKYNVCVRASLVHPYFVRLRDPYPLEKSEEDQDWGKIVGRAWEQRMSGTSTQPTSKAVRLPF